MEIVSVAPMIEQQLRDNEKALRVIVARLSGLSGLIERSAVALMLFADVGSALQ